MNCDEQSVTSHNRHGTLTYLCPQRCPHYNLWHKNGLSLTIAGDNNKSAIIYNIAKYTTLHSQVNYPGPNS